MSGDPLQSVGWVGVGDDRPDPRIYKCVNLGAGHLRNNPPGYLRVDSNAKVSPDVLHDLRVLPWPFEPSSIHEVFASHLIEHLPRTEWLGFVAELYRVCADAAIVRLVTPHRSHDDAWADPTHLNFFCFKSFQYLDAAWRARQGLEHYDFAFDFSIERPKNAIEPKWECHGGMAQMFAVEHYNNVTTEIDVTLRVHKPMRGTQTATPIPAAGAQDVTAPLAQGASSWTGT